MSAINFSLLLLLSVLWGGSFYSVEKSLVYLSFEQIGLNEKNGCLKP